jgi:hypothetical protein
MTRLAISVEGATEREFVQRVLKPHLNAFGKHVTAIDMRGNVSVDKIRGQLPALFGSFDIVSTLYDFYGFKGRGNASVIELETLILECVDLHRRVRFLPYVQKYEFEALLFAAPQVLCEWLQAGPAALPRMQGAIPHGQTAEEVNGLAATSPSHRIKEIFPGYDKKLHGPEVLELAGLAVVRPACPRFDAWVRRLEVW